MGSETSDALDTPTSPSSADQNETVEAIPADSQQGEPDAEPESEPAWGPRGPPAWARAAMPRARTKVTATKAWSS
eukprot:SAG22_NODE_8067_length_686_cov_1.098807_1_plen_75_part_00